MHFTQLYALEWHICAILCRWDTILAPGNNLWLENISNKLVKTLLGRIWRCPQYHLQRKSLIVQVKIHQQNDPDDKHCLRFIINTLVGIGPISARFLLIVWLIFSEHKLLYWAGFMTGTANNGTIMPFYHKKNCKMHEKHRQSSWMPCGGIELYFLWLWFCIIFSNIQE